VAEHESTEPKIHRGLKDVYFERSGTTLIDGRAGELSYRGYSIHDLATQSTFEEVANLLLYGALPTTAELGAFDARLKASRQLPGPVLDLISAMRACHPMEVLRTAVSALGGFDPAAADLSRVGLLAKGERLIAQVPMITAAHERIRRGKPVVAPDPTLSHAADFIWQLTGEKPSADTARLIDTDLILHAEHGSNASSFTARVVIGTEANVHAAMTAAVAALSGAAHGGAAEDVMRMALEIGDPANVPAYVARKRAAKGPITGFGHRVYRTEDPRARHMRDGVKRLSVERGEPRWYAILEALVQAQAPSARHGVAVNVDFYSGAVYYLLGVPSDLFVPIFAIGRVPGWIVQCLEQHDNNILIRPLTLYNGPAARPYVPLSAR
jgi:citrate synthase